MIIEKHGSFYSLDRCDFTVKGVDFLITGTHKVTGPYGSWYQCDVKNIETGKTKTMRHQSLCEIILKSQEDEKESIKKQPTVKPSRPKKEAKQTTLSFT